MIALSDDVELIPSDSVDCIVEMKLNKLKHKEFFVIVDTRDDFVQWSSKSFGVSLQLADNLVQIDHSIQNVVGSAEIRRETELKG